MRFPLLLDSGGRRLHLLEFYGTVCGALASSFEPVAMRHRDLAGCDEQDEQGTNAWVLVTLGCTMRQLRVEVIDCLVSLDQLQISHKIEVQRPSRARRHCVLATA